MSNHHLYGSHVPFQASKVYGFWASRENLIEAAVQCKGRASFAARFPGAYRFAYRHRLLDVLFPKPDKSPWPLDRVQRLVDAHQLHNRASLQRLSGAAYQAAYRKGFLSGSSLPSEKVRSMSNSESDEDYKHALFPLSYNYRLCICRNRIQWIVQRRVKDSSRWASIGYHRTKEGLLFRLFSKSRPVDVSPAALALLSGLPDRIE